jgi:hypothetical protein
MQCLRAVCSKCNLVEKPAETLRLASAASHLFRAANFRSGGHEFGALTKIGKALGFRSFDSGDPNVMSEHTASVIT